MIKLSGYRELVAQFNHAAFSHLAYYLVFILSFMVNCLYIYIWYIK